MAEPDWWPGTILSTALIVVGWAYFINANSFAAIWPMFGVANQMLAVIALAVLTVILAQREMRYGVCHAGPTSCLSDHDYDRRVGVGLTSLADDQHTVGQADPGSPCPDRGDYQRLAVSFW